MPNANGFEQAAYATLCSPALPGLPQVLLSWPCSGQRGQGTAAGKHAMKHAGKRASKHASKPGLLQPLTQHSGTVSMMQGDWPCYTAQRSWGEPLSPVHNLGKLLENRG